jgi:hypothetical protein
MTWLSVKDSEVIIDCLKYIESQPVRYSQIRDVISEIKTSGLEYVAIIDMTDVDIFKVNIPDALKMIWKVHMHTYNEEFVTEFRVLGSNEFIKNLWKMLSAFMPDFISEKLFIL